MKLIIITRCLHNKNNRCELHFKGIYNGYKVNKIVTNNWELNQGKDYLIFAKFLSRSDKGELLVEVIKFKEL